jgi:hypothetical protein
MPNSFPRLPWSRSGSRLIGHRVGVSRLGDFKPARPRHGVDAPSATWVPAQLFYFFGCKTTIGMGRDVRFWYST